MNDLRDRSTGPVLTEPVPRADEYHGRRALTEAELAAILEEHALWLDSDGSEGMRADLRLAELPKAELPGARLREADLHGANLDLANLQNADLRHADLSGSNLRNANLQGANLRKANVRGANLARARLSGANVSKLRGLDKANLKDVDLTDAGGLLGTEFAGLDITGATLPGEIGHFEGLAYVAESSKHARALFLSVIGACVFSWLTIATTTDLALITNSAATPLPIIQTHVPIAGFYWAAPAILLTLYLYFHLYLQGLWEGLAGLPAKFPDGRSLDERAYPWLLTSLVRAHVPLLREGRPAFSALKTAVSILSGWMLVPFTLLLFWLRYLPRHELGISLAQALAFAASLGAGLVFYHRARATLRGEKSTPIDWKSDFKDSQVHAVLLLTVFVVAWLYAICDGAIGGDPRHELAEEVGATGLHEWIPRLVAATGYRTYADLAEASLSSRPDDWWQSDEESRRRLLGVSGARLSGRDLRHADATATFLAKADLRTADLRSALLINADLRSANLLRANLEGASLFRASLQGANLRYASLRHAKLNEADLRGADLERAKLERSVLNGAELGEAKLSKARLQGASLMGAKLEKAVLPQADLSGAHLRDAVLKDADLSRAKLQGAALQGANLKRAELQRARLAQANLQGANLRDARLSGADFRGADLLEANLQQVVLTGADLSGARLERASLEGAILKGAVLLRVEGLTQRQLERSCGDKATQLPPGLQIPPCAIGEPGSGRLESQDRSE